MALGQSIEQIKANEKYPDRDFILAHFTPISPPSEKMNPLMSDECFAGFYWFKCDLLDPDKKTCTDYQNRPRICRDYPGKRENINTSLITDKCGFFERE